jgi:hypothetical protein
MAWLADEHRSVERLDLSQAGTQAGTPVPARQAFKITARGTDVNFTIYALIEAAGRYVRTVYVGRDDAESNLAFNNAGKIAAAIEQRVGQ